ncbi:MAG: winged helix-turn-helix domain-containing protein, partial [Eubacterium sp.]|nr:winged helix-turn-helix domain-containing protein [Eubacterium sp.]
MKKYTQLYNEIKSMIISGELKSGDKIPSVRKAAQIYNVSITT